MRRIARAPATIAALPNCSDRAMLARDRRPPRARRELRAGQSRVASEATMIRSTDAFLTTHTGSLPRPDDLIRMMYAKEEGVPVERAALGARVRAAVAEVVQEAGRGRHRHRQRRRDVEAELRHLRQGPARRLRRHRQHLRLPGPRRLPQSRQARVRRSRAARAARRRPATPPIGVRDADAAKADVDNLKARARRNAGEPTPS